MTTMPAWDDMSDRDKGAALIHVWRRSYFGSARAVDHPPVRYVDHPLLTALSPTHASHHAVVVARTHEYAVTSLGVEEWDRLVGAAGGLWEGTRRLS